MSSKAFVVAMAVAVAAAAGPGLAKRRTDQPRAHVDRTVQRNVRDTLAEGQRTFRFDTFGDEGFWGDTLGLHRTIEGDQHGGVGPGLSPKAALQLGLKVDVDALPGKVRSGQIGRASCRERV